MSAPRRVGPPRPGMSARHDSGPATAPALDARAWRGLDGLRAQQPAWRELLAAAPVEELSNEPEWVLAHAQAFSDPASLFGWTLFEPGGSPVALLAFRREPSRGPLALRRALFCADGTFDSDYLDLLVRPGFEAASVAACLDALAATRGVAVALLSRLPDDSPTLPLLRAELARRGLASRELAEPACVAALPESFEAYVAGLKPRMRSKVRSSVRRARETGGVVRWCTDAAALERDLETLFELHQARWTAAGRPGGFAGPERRAFYRAIAASYLERDRLGFASLAVDGRVVACQIGAVAGGTYYQLQEGYDPAFEAFRPGTALRGLVIEELIARGVTTYDFLEGVSRHKTDWGGAVRPCTTVAVALPGLRARVAFGARELVERWRGRGPAE